MLRENLSLTTNFSKALTFSVWATFIKTEFPAVFCTLYYFLLSFTSFYPVSIAISQSIRLSRQRNYLTFSPGIAVEWHPKTHSSQTSPWPWTWKAPFAGFKVHWHAYRSLTLGAPWQLLGLIPGFPAFWNFQKEFWEVSWLESGFTVQM